MSADTSSESNSGPIMRLQRYLAQCGLGSRRDCEELITTGRVTIDGKTASVLGTSLNPQTQAVALDGEPLRLERKKYYVLNKPSGYMCTASDPQGRRLVLDLFPSEGPRLFTVGRLDENTTGLIIVTNDGDLAQKLAHPRYRIFRVYKAQVAGHPERAVFDELKEGMFFTEGKFRVHNVKSLKKQGKSTWVEITMSEGQNREIRRLFARAGHKVMKLERLSFGPIKLGRVPLGSYRELRKPELEELFGLLARNQLQDEEPEQEQELEQKVKRSPAQRRSKGLVETTESVTEKPERVFEDRGTIGSGKKSTGKRITGTKRKTGKKIATHEKRESKRGASRLNKKTPPKEK